MSLPDPPSPDSTPPVASPHGLPETTTRTWAGADWGLGDAWMGIVASQVMAAIIGGAILALAGYDSVDDVPMRIFGLLNLPLHATLAAVALWVSAAKGRGPVVDYRIRMVPGDIPTGILCGLFAQFVLVPVVTLPFIWLSDKTLDDLGESARELADRADDPLGVTVLIITVGVIAPIVEELFFRGLLFGAYRKRRNLRWLEMFLPPGRRPDTTTRRWNDAVALVLSSAIFSAVHFQLLLFPALFAAGFVFAELARRYRRLGPAIWAHATFNAATLVTLLT